MATNKKYKNVLDVLYNQKPVPLPDPDAPKKDGPYAKLIRSMYDIPEPSETREPEKNPEDKEAKDDAIGHSVPDTAAPAQADMPEQTKEKKPAQSPKKEKPTPPKDKGREGAKKSGRPVSYKFDEVSTYYLKLEKKSFDKAKMIAAKEGISFLKLINDALNDYITRWEAKNGKL